MAIKLRVEVTDEDGTLAEYRVEDSDNDANTAGRLAWIVGYAYRALEPFLQEGWDDLLVSLVDGATESLFTPIGDDAVLVPNAIIDHVALRYIDFVARAFPELKIIISHGGYPWVNEAITVAQRNRNVYIDLSEYEFSPMAEAYVEAANTMIADKILYASAHPFVDFKIALKNYEKLPLNPDVRQKIMYDNAAKLLGLRPPIAPVRADTPQVHDLVSEIVREVMARLGR